MIFSADIEDWQQSVYDFDREVSNRVVRNTHRLLDILERHRVNGTFFVQGMVAEKFPTLVTSIMEAGHELACHSYSHRLIYNLTEAQFREEIRRSVGILEDISGKKILGFRAPTFSVRDEILDWYCDALTTNGIIYDSSIMIAQVRSDYGFADDAILQRLKARGLDSYPMSVGNLLGKRLPVMGGGYFRIYPYWFTRWLGRNLNPQTSVFYMHPYETDTDEYREVSKLVPISRKMAFHQFARRNTVTNKLHRLFNDYRFNSFQNIYYPETLY
jgi:polysaccharide deacetylase family protein (PEP-CTERM system associated)